MYGFTVKRASKKNPKKVKSRHTFFGKTAKAAKSAAMAFFGKKKRKNSRKRKRNRRRR